MAVALSGLGVWALQDGMRKPQTASQASRIINIFTL